MFELFLYIIYFILTFSKTDFNTEHDLFTDNIYICVDF